MSADHYRCAARSVWPSGFWVRGCAALQVIHMHIYYTRVSVNLDTNYPFHGCAHYLMMVLSMVSIICSFWLGGSNEVSSIQWGMRAPPLYYRSCASDGVWLFAAVRAPHHMTRTGPVVPKKRRCLGLLVVGLGVALCELNFQGDCTHLQKRVCMA